MKIFINDIEIDSTNELNLFFNNEFGIDITIYYNINFFGCKHYKKIYKTTYHNFYQVNYDYSEDSFKENKIAFESDIQNCGFIRNILDIDKIVIKKSKKKYNNFYSKRIFINN